MEQEFSHQRSRDVMPNTPTRLHMTESNEQVVFAILLTILSYGVLPAVLVWGWVRWCKRPKLRTLPSIISLVGFILATASATLAASALAYASFVRFSSGLDPVLYRMFGSGMWISFAGILFSVSGAWRQSSLRWHAPVCALGTLAFWMTHWQFFPIVD
jgi:hypothetical protein